METVDEGMHALLPRIHRNQRRRPFSVRSKNYTKEPQTDQYLNEAKTYDAPMRKTSKAR